MIQFLCMTEFEKLIPRIVSWYAEHRRDLPWRHTRDAYAIWVSEVMLQQTRVEAVLPYYTRFMKELPDLAALAACPEDRLLKLWEGLGYYSRVRNLQKAAKILVEAAEEEPAANAKGPDADEKTSRKSARKKKVPALPQDPKELRALPGIGEYTAGAIASLAFGVPVPAIDGNVLRVMARLRAEERPVKDPAFHREIAAGLTEALEKAVAKSTLKNLPGTFNQGLMDLGATVCLPNAQPHCTACPLRRLCRAHREKNETAYPMRSKAKERRIEQRTILLLRDGERVVLTRRPEKGLLAGLYEFPNLPGTYRQKEILRFVEEQVLQGLRPEVLQITSLPKATHVFTHVEWQMQGYEIRLASFPATLPQRETRTPGKWFLADVKKIRNEVPLPSAYRVYAERIQLPLGMERQKPT